MPRFREICSRVETTDPETGAVTVSFETVRVAFTPEEEAQADAEATPTTEQLLAAEDESFLQKKSAMMQRMSTLDLIDGANYAAKRTALQGEYTALVAEHNANVDAILFG